MEEYDWSKKKNGTIQTHTGELKYMKVKYYRDCLMLSNDEKNDKRWLTVNFKINAFMKILGGDQEC